MYYNILYADYGKNCLTRIRYTLRSPARGQYSRRETERTDAMGIHSAMTDRRKKSPSIPQSLGSPSLEG